LEKVWVISEQFYLMRDQFGSNRVAEINAVKNYTHFTESVSPEERFLVLASLADSKKVVSNFPKILATGLLPPELSSDRVLLAVRALIKDARLQHDLEAAESIAWSGVGFGKFDDDGIEELGSSILLLSEARDMAAVELVLKEVCHKVAPVEQVRVAAFPEPSDSSLLASFHLVVPVQFKGELVAHTYVKFKEESSQEVNEKVSEALLNLSDAIALAVERNRMITKAEETKAVWEASFDAVKDPVAILDAELKILRGNVAFGKLLQVPLPKLAGKISPLEEELRSRLDQQNSEWTVEFQGRHYRAFFDGISSSHGSGRYVLRFHDITEERSLTEKILAKEQVAELGILVGSVAHEVNNPIGGILAISQILQKDVKPDSPFHKDISEIIQSAERCKRIIQTMLSLVRKGEGEKAELSLSETLKSAVDLLGSEAKRLNVKLLTQFSPEGAEPIIEGKKNRILQVFFHLIQHSLFALAERRKRESFEAFLKLEITKSFSHFEVRIEDNGDRAKHDYEIQSSVAFTVSRMILEEEEANFQFTSVNGKNLQRITFSIPERRSGN